MDQYGESFLFSSACFWSHCCNRAKAAFFAYTMGTAAISTVYVFALAVYCQQKLMNKRQYLHLALNKFVTVRQGFVTASCRCSDPKQSEHHGGAQLQAPRFNCEFCILSPSLHGYCDDPASHLGLNLILHPV